VGESSFWYRPTRVVPDQRPLNGRCCCCCIACRLTAKNRDQLRNATLGNRVWATFSFLRSTGCVCLLAHKCLHGLASLTSTTVCCCRSVQQTAGSPAVCASNPHCRDGLPWRLLRCCCIAERFAAFVRIFCFTCSRVALDVEPWNERVTLRRFCTGCKILKRVS